MVKQYIGDDVDNFLEEQGILADVEAIALKRVFAWEMEKTMKELKINTVQAAKRLGTSRAAFDRLLDPSNTGVTLKSLEKAAIAFGKRIHFELRDASY